jgi:endonuclease YncB( thermonuclease family)
MLDHKKCTLYSGGLKGAENAFGEEAEKWQVREVAYTFAGNKIARSKNALLLSKEELQRGDISMELVSKMMRRTYYHTDKIRKVLQTIFHMVNSGHQVFVIGNIQADNTVKGGTGPAVVGI